eukprot:scaffold735_cov116-Cylindrotheca_fusiformis.AAC.14
MIQTHKTRTVTMKSILLLATMITMINGFVVNPLSPRPRPSSLRWTTRLFAELPDIGKMKAGEMRKELESYGISTKSLFEKSEFVEALKKARAEGKTAVKNNDNKTSDDSSKASTTAEDSTTTTNGEDTASSSSREERYKKALEKAKGMKVGELKKELTNRGISTASFFEKTEFVKAYAEAVADNKKGKGGGSRQEPHDPSFRDVTMQKISKGSLMGQKVIDVMVR